MTRGDLYEMEQIDVNGFAQGSCLGFVHRSIRKPKRVTTKGEIWSHEVGSVVTVRILQ
jgi:hypothetical protein